MAGIVRKIDELGRIVIPKGFRKILNWKESETEVEISLINNKVIINEVLEGCCICGNTKNVNYNIDGKGLCKECKNKIKEL